MTSKMIWISTLILIIFIAKVHCNTCRKELSYNQFYGYGYTIFCNNTNQEELSSISVYNELSLTITGSNLTLNKHVFKNLSRIRELRISETNINYSKDQIDLPKLEKLTLSSVNLESINSTFLRGLKLLKVLNLDSNRIRTIPDNTFEDLRELKQLNLSHNLVAKVEDLHLCVLHELVRLDLSYNNIKSLSTISIKCFPNLEYLNLNNNFLTNIGPLNLPNLNEFYARHNRFVSLENITAVNLITLDLAFNKIRTINTDLPSLLDIDLSNNTLTEITEYQFRGNPKLRKINLTNNKLKYVNFNVSTIETLNMDYNELETILLKNFSMLTGLTTLSLAHNHLKVFEAGSLKSMKAIEKLDLSSNFLRHFELILNHNTVIRSLNLSKNNITVVNPTMFNNFGSLRHLDISQNHIEYLNSTIFSKLENLEVLNISYNKLTELDYQVVDPLENLRILDVEGNLLKTIDYSLIITDLPNLDVINVKNNLLTCDFIGKMIRYYKENGINYTINESFQYDQENVAGIYCKETEDKLNSLEETLGMVRNNSKLITKLYQLTKDSESGSSNSTITIVIVVLLLCFISIAISCLVLYKYKMWMRRKNYILDELELISEPYTVLGK